MISAYDDLILDHIRNARNYRALEGPVRTISGANALCGDELLLYVRMDGDRIDDIGFQCTCCGLSMASASVMTGAVKGRDIAGARRLLIGFTGQLDGTAPVGGAALSREQQALLDARQRFPARARCLLLPWTTLMTAFPG